MPKHFACVGFNGIHIELVSLDWYPISLQVTSKSDMRLMCEGVEGDNRFFGENLCKPHNSPLPNKTVAVQIGPCPIKTKQTQEK
jgi:hypothetical protein